MLQVGGHIDVTAEGDSQRIVDHPELTQVGMTEVATDGGLHRAPVGEGVETEQTFDHRIGAVGIDLDAAATDVGRELDVVEVVAVVAQPVDVSHGIDAGAGRHDVGACAVGRDGAGEGRNGLMDKEMSQRQAVGRKTGAVGHAAGVEADIAAKRSPTLRGNEA